MWFWRLLLLLFLVQDDADDVPLMLLHVLHQSLFARGFEAADAAAEEEHAVLHAGAGDGGRVACARLLELGRVLPPWTRGFTGPLW